MAPNRCDRLRAMLADLKIPGALDVVDGILSEADSGAISPAEAIEQLLNAQIVLHNNRRLQTAMRSSGLGRKNYLFMGSASGGRAAAIAYTLPADVPVVFHVVEARERAGAYEGLIRAIWLWSSPAGSVAVSGGTLVRSDSQVYSAWSGRTARAVSFMERERPVSSSSSRILLDAATWP